MRKLFLIISACLMTINVNAQEKKSIISILENGYWKTSIPENPVGQIYNFKNNTVTIKYFTTDDSKSEIVSENNLFYSGAVQYYLTDTFDYFWDKDQYKKKLNGKFIVIHFGGWVKKSENYTQEEIYASKKLALVFKITINNNEEIVLTKPKESQNIGGVKIIVLNKIKSR